VLVAGRSASCQQTIRFDCLNAPLLFARNLTWLETAAGMKGDRLTRLGVEPGACACRNPDLYGCSKQSE
jgi:hypothetical protein